MSSKKSENKKSANVQIKRVVANKAAVGKVIDLHLPKESKLGNYIRTFTGTDSNVSFSWTIHRFIGSNPDDVSLNWYVSADADIPTLLARSVDPDRERLQNHRINWLNDQAVGKRLLRFDKSRGKLVYAGFSDEITRKTLKDQVRKDWANKNPNKKSKEFDLYQVLKSDDYLKNPIAEAEIAIIDLFKQLSVQANEKSKSTYITMGGPSGDQPQRELEWARGLESPAVADNISMYGIHGPPKISGNGDTGDEDISVVSSAAESCEHVLTLDEVAVFIADFTNKSKEDILDWICKQNGPNESEAANE